MKRSNKASKVITCAEAYNFKYLRSIYLDGSKYQQYINRPNFKNIDSDLLMEIEEYLERVILEGAPDYIIVNGIKIPFVYIDSKNIVIKLLNYDGANEFYYDGFDNDCNKMLIEFFKKNFKENFEYIPSCTWNYFNSLNNGIAYRGGRGYLYTCYDYIKNKVE